MAFLNRVGNLLKHSASKNVTLGFSASNASLLQAVRSMSTSSKLFVGGLSYSTDEMSLREAFSQYGEVVEARVILDRETGRSRGFGFVTFTSTEAASSAIQAFDGQEYRIITSNCDFFRIFMGGELGGYPSGGGSGYGDSGSVQGDGNYNSGSGSNYFSGEKPGFASLLNDDTTGLVGGRQEPLGGDVEAGNEDFGPDVVDENDRDDDEPNDYANTRS
ncbi:hypothetical protein DH2020_037115 [Rehmannia glutinosa]|uniref:RRM domain-containing protein n=1 Tax=Rehmannia glutinosa TaxID=99300 RepID=A0ABR0V1Z3_REHGL